MTKVTTPLLAGGREGETVVERRVVILGQGEFLCPCCLGSGIKPSAITSYVEVCEWCNGAGKQ